jgi:hypothetical protein
MSVYHTKERDWKAGLVAAKESVPPQSPFTADCSLAFKDFITFQDHTGYDGWTGKANFWRRLCSEAQARKLPHQLRSLHMVDGEILKGDHSRKTDKYIRLSGKSIYTVMI